MKVTTALRLAIANNPKPVPERPVRKGATELAAVLGISKQAVQNWGDDVPKKQEAELRRLRPGWFKK